jgi:hypothetical protein
VKITGSTQNGPRHLKRINALHWQTPARGSFDPQRLSGALANRLAPRRATAIHAIGTSARKTCEPTASGASHGRRGRKKSEINPLGVLSHVACRISSDMRQMRQPTSSKNECPTCPKSPRVSYMSKSPDAALRPGRARCQRAPVQGRKRCRLHGGLSPGAPRGNRNGNYTNGEWTAEAIEERRWLRSLVREFAKT